MKETARKIVLIVQDFPKTSETFIAGKFARLNQNGQNVHVLCNKEHPERWSQFPGLASNQELRRRLHVSWPHNSRWTATLLLPILMMRCLVRRPLTTARYLRRGYRQFGTDIVRRFYLDSELVLLNPDLIHFEFGAIANGRMYLASMLNCKVVVSFRGYDLNYVGLENPDHYRDIWEKADLIHLLGEDLWRKAKRRGCPEYKPRVLIPPAIDTSLFQCTRETPNVAGSGDRPLRILSIGSLEWKKGYEYALDAVKLLKEKGIHFEYRIVGEGEYLEAMMFARHELGLNDEVSFPGALRHTEVREQLLWADVLLHSAVSEGFCNAVLEAQAMALPVVCTDAGGLPENVLHGCTGFVVPRRNANMITSHLALLAQRPELREQMGNAGRKRVESEFTIEHQVARVERMYDDLLSIEHAANGKVTESLLASSQSD